MKKIQAIIRREKLIDIMDKLVEADILGITVQNVRGRGNQKNIELQFRGRIFSVNLLPKTKIELMINDEDVEKVVNIIQKTAHTGNIGDGKIIILPIDDIIRIRTGERGSKAI